MMTSKIVIPIAIHILIFISFHHICFLTRFAPRRKPCADWARLSATALVSKFGFMHSGVVGGWELEVGSREVGKRGLVNTGLIL